MNPATSITDPFFQLASECPVEAWLGVLGHRWNALILYHLSLAPRRFGELHACIPTVTAKVLTERLTELTTRGLVVHTDGRYHLTCDGELLMPILHGIERWAAQHDERRRQLTAALQGL